MHEQILSLQFSTLDLELKNTLPILVHKKFIEIYMSIYDMYLQLGNFSALQL